MPTAAALQVAKEGMPLVLKVEALTQSITSRLNVAYHVRIGCLNSMDIICLGKTLKSFQQIEPTWEFHVVEENLTFGTANL